MIKVVDLSARGRKPAVALGPLSFALEAGSSSALIGGDTDGVSLLLAVLAGSAEPSKGQVVVNGEPAQPRATVAYVPFASDLPPAMRVDELLGTAARVRGEKVTPPEERLALLGLEVLVRRRIGSLTPGEARAVALVEAITSEASILLLDEPLSDVDPRAFARLGDALAARVRAGATLVVSTASVDDARELTVEQLYFERGKLVRRATADDALTRLTSAGARLLVRGDNPRALLAALASDPSVGDMSSDGPLLTLSGTDSVAMASAVARAAEEAGIELDLMELAPPEGAP